VLCYEVEDPPCHRTLVCCVVRLKIFPVIGVLCVVRLKIFPVIGQLCVVL
jgi:hypothetical protein